MNEFWEWVYLEIETLGLNYIAWNNEPQDFDDRVNTAWMSEQSYKLSYL